MNTFPSTPKPLQTSGESSTLKMINSGFENGTGQSRKKNTKDRKIWKLDYRCDRTGYDTMRNFFNTNKGDTIIFVSPFDSVTYYAKIMQDSLDMKLASNSTTHFEFSIQVNEI